MVVAFPNYLRFVLSLGIYTECYLDVGIPEIASSPIAT